MLSVLIGDQTSISADLANRVNLKIDSQLWSFDNDVAGLVQGNDIVFYKSDTEIVEFGSKLTNFTGWDGDFLGVRFAFETRAEHKAIVKKAIFRLIAYKNDLEQFEISQTNIPIFKIAITDENITTYPYQLANVDVQNSFNITPNESFNRITLDSTVPVYGTAYQEWVGTLAFEVKWREWIANLDVANIFYDATKDNNNLNEKTSNYSNLNGYDIYGVVDLNIGSNQGEDTVYRIFSDISSELDFDVSGSNPFTGTTFFLRY